MGVEIIELREESVGVETYEPEGATA